jgi:hypothetical protein
MTTFALMILLMLQMRSQQQATAALIEDNRIRTGLFQDADESTSFILTRTIQNIADGESDPSLESDTFALRVVREVVKRKLPKSKWLEIQSNERLVHELYLLLREGADKKGPQVVRAKA